MLFVFRGFGVGCECIHRGRRGGGRGGGRTERDRGRAAIRNKRRERKTALVARKKTRNKKQNGKEKDSRDAPPEHEGREEAVGQVARQQDGLDRVVHAEVEAAVHDDADARDGLLSVGLVWSVGLVLFCFVIRCWIGLRLCFGVVIGMDCD